MSLLPCLAGRWHGQPVGNQAVAPPVYIGTAGGDATDQLIRWDLINQVKPHQPISDVSSGQLDRTELGCHYTILGTDLVSATAFSYL